VKELELRDERLRILEGRYEARITGLKNEVLRLRENMLTGDAQESSTQKRKDGPGSLGDRSRVIQAQKDEAQLSDPRNEPQAAKCPQPAQNTNAPANAKAAQKTITVNKTYADTAAVPVVTGGEWHKVTGKSVKGREAKEAKKLVPEKGLDREARKLIFRREKADAPKANKPDLILALNKMLVQKGLPVFARIVDASYTTTGAIFAILAEGSSKHDARRWLPRPAGGGG
jgi:hypothetical protein